jgi:Protein of unknown function (DUF4446)
VPCGAGATRRFRLLDSGRLSGGFHLDFITNNLAAIAMVLAGLCLVAMVTLQAMQLSNLRRRVDQLTGGVGEGTLEDVLVQHLESVHDMGRDVDELIARTAFLESSARHHFARQGLVRFNPFPDTGGNQSFVLALLDESDDGVIISSLHSRTGTRIYAKGVVGGKADTTLSAEEEEAIDDARARRAARTAPAPRAAVKPSGATPVSAQAEGSGRGSARTPAGAVAKAAAPAPARAARAAAVQVSSAPAPATPPVATPAPATPPVAAVAPAPVPAPAPAPEVAPEAPKARAPQPVAPVRAPSPEVGPKPAEKVAAAKGQSKGAAPTASAGEDTSADRTGKRLARRSTGERAQGPQAE